MTNPFICCDKVLDHIIDKKNELGIQDEPGQLTDKDVAKSIFIMFCVFGHGKDLCNMIDKHLEERCIRRI